MAGDHRGRGWQPNGGLLDSDLEGGDSKREGLDCPPAGNLLENQVDSTGSDPSGSLSKTGIGPVRVLNTAEREIRNILAISNLSEKNLLNVAKTTWEAKDEMLSTRIEKKKSRSQSLKNEIYQLIGFYVVFQGVLLTGVTTSNLLHCNNARFMLTLSALASLVAMIGVAQKLFAVRIVEREILDEDVPRRINFTYLSNLIAVGKKFDFSTNAREASISVKPSKLRQWYSFVLVIIVLMTFSGLFLASIQIITCYPGPKPEGY